MTTEALMNTYGPRAATLVKGEGAWLWDDRGNRYLDGLSGIAVCGLGHSHPAIATAVAQQASELTHCSNFFANHFFKGTEMAITTNPTMALGPMYNINMVNATTI